VTVAFVTAPPEPFVPDEFQGRPAVGVLVCYVGDIEEGQRLVAPLRDAFAPVVDLVGPMPYAVHQTLMDATTPWGRQVFLKSANLKELSDDVIATVVDHATHATSPMTIVPINSWGGAISRVPEDATAFGHRDSKFTIYIFAMWSGRADGERHIAWARAFHTALRPHMNGIYVNEMGTDERVSEAYSPATYARLVEVKDEFDPMNFFQMNQNIRPTG
jgi:FAD/FMN-containing dehydrogenase